VYGFNYGGVGNLLPYYKTLIIIPSSHLIVTTGYGVSPFYNIYMVG